MMNFRKNQSYRSVYLGLQGELRYKHERFAYYNPFSTSALTCSMRVCSEPLGEGTAKRIRWLETIQINSGLRMRSTRTISGTKIRLIRKLISLHLVMSLNCLLERLHGFA